MKKEIYLAPRAELIELAPPLLLQSFLSGNLDGGVHEEADVFVPGTISQDEYYD